MRNLSYLFLLILATNSTFSYAASVEQDNDLNDSSLDTSESHSILRDKSGNGCGGYLRAGFIQTNIRSVDTSSANAFSAEVDCSYQLNPYIKANLGLFGVLDYGVNSQTDDNIHADFFNRKKDSYLMLGEAFLTLSYGDFDARLGRQRIDSPHFDGDDLRMVPNLFEAYLVDYHFSNELAIGTGFVREAAGWENGGDLSHFIPIGEALGGKGAGTWLSWLTYEEEHLSGAAWFYYIPNHLTIFYGELVYEDSLTDDIDYTLSFQYDWGRDSGPARLGEVEAHTFGVMATTSLYDFTLTVAFNKNLGHTGALASVGGGPFYTSLEDQTLDAASGDDTQSVLFGIEYEVIGGLSLGVAAAEYRASNKHDYQVEEINYYLNYNWDDKLSAELMYAVTDDKNSSEDMDQIRVIINYQY